MKPHCQKCFHEKKVYLNDIVNYTPVQKPNTELEILRSSTIYSVVHATDFWYKLR